ncbi:MAG: NAD-dependent epimerase/dehydratase family protein [Megasphaera sp.]|jgi:nucleoside-diphosphate-sugar epimerase|nr:NAD-dependent epimerase/dehydratase family protein [Megasphaera sp.]
MKVVVVGGSGHIGTYLIPMLVRGGYEVISVTRGQSKPYEDNPAWNRVKHILLDRGKENDFANKIARMEPDIVVDLINFSIKDTQAMVKALRNSRCCHYLFCSSCWAHGRAEILPMCPDDLQKHPLDGYGKDKFASELYLKKAWLHEGFPSTVIMPGQISGPGWVIINPWGNTSLRPFNLAAHGEKIILPNFGMETIHHVHGYDVAQVFFLAIIHRNQALGETFDATSGSSITLYGYAKLLFEFFNKEPQIDFLPWKEWCEYEGNKAECDHTFYHIARSGFYSIQKEEKLLGYHPRYTNIETIMLAVKSYVKRGLIQTSK